MQQNKRPGPEKAMDNVVMSCDDLWPGIEERLLEENPPTPNQDRAEPPPDTVDEEP